MIILLSVNVQCLADARQGKKKWDFWDYDCWNFKLWNFYTEFNPTSHEEADGYAAATVGEVDEEIVDFELVEIL